MVRIRFFAIVLALISVLAVFTACKKGCKTHADGDKDGWCDICGESVGISCTSHTDSDKNGKCDTCGVAVQVACTSHSDADNDGKCDTCGVTVEAECTEHTDADNDEKCDNCGADVPKDDEDGGVIGDIGGGKLPPDVDLPLDPFV